DKILTYRRSDGTLKRKDYKIQIPPRFNYQSGDVVQVELFGTIEDIIPIIQLDYSTFVKGVYKKRGVVERSIVIEGTKSVRMGNRVPTGSNEISFWSAIYRRLKETILDEFVNKALEQDGFPDNFDLSEREILPQGDFPQDYTELRR
ncbi:MAG: hypothetical protein AABY22_30280, partial [Nanoarchaeota archaeon]